MSEPVSRRLLTTLQQAVRHTNRLVRPMPRLAVEVLLPPLSGDTTAAVRAAVSAAAMGYVQDLGIPARPVVTVEVDASTTQASLRIGGRRARLLPADYGHSGEPASELIAAVLRSALEHDFSLLVGPAQREELVARLRATGSWDVTDRVLAAALERTIAHGVSVQDVLPLRSAWKANESPRDPDELAEVFIEALAPRALYVRLSPSTMRAATAEPTQLSAFIELRLRVFEGSGLHLPDILLRERAGMPDGTCEVQLNSVTLLPRPLAASDLASVAAVVEHQVRAHAAWLVSAEEVRSTVSTLELALPELVRSVRDRYRVTQLAVFARALIEESVPIRNTARLLVLLLDATEPNERGDVVRLTDATRRSDDHHAEPVTARHLVSYARQQMNEEIARTRPGTSTRDVYRLPAALEREVERAALARRPLDAGTADRLIAVAEEFTRGELRVQGIVVATQLTRAAVRDQLAAQYPDLAVWASQEFAPGDRLVASTRS